MIVCHAHKFIFLKTRKTAGTSIEAALAHLCGPDDIVTPISPKDEPLRGDGAGPRNHRGRFNPVPELFLPGTDKTRTVRDAWRGRKFFNHIGAAQIRNRLGRATWDSYFKFCFERNPWDKMVSRFHWDNRGKTPPLTWDEFLAKGEFRSDVGLYTINGALAVDFVGRYEHLEEDLNEALTRVGITDKLELPRAKGGHRPSNQDGPKKDKADFHDYYKDGDREIVARAFAREIELFDYEF